jgi:hypothetical protein
MEHCLPFSLLSLAPATGFEPVTFRLTAERSTAELRRIIHFLFQEKDNFVILTFLAVSVNSFIDYCMVWSRMDVKLMEGIYGRNIGKRL